MASLQSQDEPPDWQPDLVQDLIKKSMNGLKDSWTDRQTMS